MQRLSESLVIILQFGLLVGCVSPSTRVPALAVVRPAKIRRT